MDEDKSYYHQFKAFEDLMFCVKHKLSERDVILCLRKLELEMLNKDLEKSEKKIEEIRNEFFKK